MAVRNCVWNFYKCMNDWTLQISQNKFYWAISRSLAFLFFLHFIQRNKLSSKWLLSNLNYCNHTVYKFMCYSQGIKEMKIVCTVRRIMDFLAIAQIQKNNAWNFFRKPSRKCTRERWVSLPQQDCFWCSEFTTGPHHFGEGAFITRTMGSPRSKNLPPGKTFW